MNGWKKTTVTAAFAAALALPFGSALAQEASSPQELTKVSIVTFGPPSYGAFLPPVIKQMKLDEKHGLSIEFADRPPDAYSVQFNSGEFKVGASASLLTLGLAAQQGVKVTYLFNLYDYWSAVVSSRPDIQTLKDLEGKDLVGATGTTTYKIFEWLAKRQGVDLSTASVVNTASPGLVGYAVADRASAVHLWDPGYTTLLLKKPDIRSLDLKIKETWREYAGSDTIPYLGVAAHTSWVEENPGAAEKLYAAYKDAADWVLANPDEASKIIMASAEPDIQAAVADLIRENDRLGLKIDWAADVEKELNAILEMGKELNLLSNTDNISFYGPKKQ